MPTSTPRLLPLALLLTACATRTPPAAEPVAGAPAANADAPADEIAIADDVSVRRIAPGVWVHVTLGDGPYDGIPANGLLVEDGDGSWLVDTGWTTAQGEALLRWADEGLGKPIVGAVVTHAHLDRTGGIEAFAARGVPVHALDETVRLTPEQGRSAPMIAFAGDHALGPIQVMAPGPGHAPDNVVVWHAGSRVLHGGCFVKDAHADDLGNLSDADPAAWPASLGRVRERYPDAVIVVPGHGELGGLELLDHTAALAEAASR